MLTKIYDLLFDRRGFRVEGHKATKRHTMVRQHAPNLRCALLPRMLRRCARHSGRAAPHPRALARGTAYLSRHPELFWPVTERLLDANKRGHTPPLMLPATPAARLTPQQHTRDITCLSRDTEPRADTHRGTARP